MNVTLESAGNGFITVPEHGARDSRWNSERITVSLLLGLGIAIGVIVPTLMALQTGSYSIPHNDDWSYSRIAQEFGRSGKIHLLQWNRSSLVGQFIPLGPVAASVAMQHLFVGLLAVGGIYACYDLLKSLIGKSRAAFAAALIGIWPEFGLLSTSFMTDVPAFAAATITLAVGKRAIEGGSGRLLLASSVLGLWGVTIREQVLAAPAAVLAVAFWDAWRQRSFRLRQVIAVGAAFLAAVACFELWRRGLTGDDPPTGVTEKTPPILVDVVDLIVRGYFLLALYASPVLLALVRPWQWGRKAWLAAGAVAFVAVLEIHDVGSSVFVFSDYLKPGGPYSVVMPGNRYMLHPTVWHLLCVLAAGAGILMAGGLVQWKARLNPLLNAYFLIMSVGTLGTRVAGQTISGRYLMLFVPVILAIVLGWRRERVQRRSWYELSMGIVTALFLVMVSLGTTAYGHAFDGARWAAGEKIVEMGIDPADIDAGFEWSGYHSPNGVETGSMRQAAMNYYQTLLPNNRHCYLVSPVPRQDAGWRLVGTLEYKKYVVARPTQLWLYSTGLCGSDE